LVGIVVDGVKALTKLCAVLISSGFIAVRKVREMSGKNIDQGSQGKWGLAAKVREVMEKS